MRNSLSIFTLAVTTALAVAVTGCSNRTAKTIYHERRADNFFKSGDFDKAEVEYMNVLRADAENARAIGQLGIIYYDQGRLQRAAPFLFKAVQLDTNNVAVHLKLGFLYQSVGKLKEARDEANFVLHRQGTNDEAPLLLAQTAQMDNSAGGAKKELLQLAQSHDTAGIETALGIIAMNEGDLKTAESDLQRARSMDSKSNPEIYAALGNLAWTRNDLRLAATYFSTAADMAPPRSPLRMEYAQFLIKTGDTDSAKKILDQMTARTPDYISAWIGKAQVALADKRYDDCAKFIAGTFQRDPDNYQAMMLASQLDFVKGDRNKAVTDLEQMAKKFPQSPQVQYQLGLAYLADGRRGDAVQCLTRVVNVDTNFTDAAILLSGIHIKSGNPLPAIVLLKHVLQNQPQNPQAKLLLAEADRVQGNTAEAMAIYQAMEKSFPTNSQLPVLMGATFLQEQKYDDARNQFNHALQLNPRNFVAIEQLVDLDLMNRQFADATKLADNATAENPKDASPMLLQAKIALAQSDTNRAADILWKTYKTNPTNSNPPLLLAQIYFDRGDLDKSSTLLEDVLGRDTNNISALMLTARIQTAKNNFEGAAANYEKVLAMEPQFSPALNNLAVLYCNQLGQLDKALDLAQRARQLLPFNPSVADTLGWVLCKKGNYSGAVSLLQEAATKAPGNPEFQYHLGKAFYLMGKEAPARAALELASQMTTAFPERDDCRQCLAILAIDPATANDAARVTLEKRIAEEPNDTAASARLAAIYRRIGATDKAMATDEAALKADPQNAQAMIDLAQLHATNDFSRAMNLAKSAYKIAPEDTTICATLGKFAFQSGNFQWSQTLLQQAALNQSADAEIQFDLANADYALGKIADAQSAMQTAATGNLPPEKAMEAKQFLDLTSATNSETATEQESVARGVLRSRPEDVPALMVVAMVAQKNSQTDVAEQNYEKVLERFPDFAPAQKQLAILYSQTPATVAKAASLARKALQNLPGDPELSKLLGVISFQRGDYANAENFLETAAQTSPDADVLYYLGAAQFHLKNREESRTALQRALALNLSGDRAADAKKLLAQLK
ncbi:MAG TPA: tetratricopeptide repeat protein [Verrucomicrobiae bacterium]|nr:tetratricopeptide repeat protein [Verrucomicrobiae bacterium]